MSWPEDMSTANLVVELRKLAKNASYRKPAVRAKVLNMAADRLSEYRQRERGEQ